MLICDFRNKLHLRFYQTALQLLPKSIVNLLLNRFCNLNAIVIKGIMLNMNMHERKEMHSILNLVENEGE